MPKGSDPRIDMVPAGGEGGLVGRSNFDEGSMLQATDGVEQTGAWVAAHDAQVERTQMDADTLFGRTHHAV